MTHHHAVSVRTETQIRLEKGAATFFSFCNLPDGKEHLLIRFGEAATQATPLVRIHSECLTGDVFASLHCDCGPQLAEAIESMSQSSGYIIYLRQEGRGIGLYSKLESYALQATGLDTFEANAQLKLRDDYRDYSPAAQMLMAAGVHRVRLLSNNPDKAEQLSRAGIEVVEVQPTQRHENEHNARYIRTKEVKAKHVFAR